jgi:UDP-N-acetylglucosamine 1-carboxyvinyltransferase
MVGVRNVPRPLIRKGFIHMDAFKIKGGNPLKGVVHVSGSKNAALPVLAASLLAPGKSFLHNVPLLSDIETLGKVLSFMGCVVQRENASSLSIDATHLPTHEAPYELVRTMRASVLVLGPLLARFGHAKVSLPGGCAIGARPVDQHLKGMEALGAVCTVEHGYILASAPKGLQGADVYFDMPTVTGTENLMLAATLAKGTTVLHNAACEPEIEDLAKALISMGAQIEGAGTERITVHGVTSLKPYNHHVVADRIECGTFLVAGALAGAPLIIRNGVPAHQETLIHKLREVGATVVLHPNNDMEVHKANAPQAVNIQTAPYPGFPTDMQAQFMTLLCLSQGASLVMETIFENRFMHVAELCRLGAHIKVEGGHAFVTGVQHLSGTTVMATDLRASACLVLAGLVAEGETSIRRIYHLDRGYDHIETKLRSVGADIERFKET